MTPDAGEPRPPIRSESGEQPYLAGDVIGRKYRLERVLGEGGMGAVWLARNLSLDLDVAVKLIRRQVARPETARRLLQEARAAARLNHPSIVRVFDFGESELGDPFIVMEVLSGQSFRELLDRKARLPSTTAVRTLLPIVSALAAAHAQDIVHRDLKPENVVLVGDETGAVIPKVVDFGIAKLRRKEADGKITVAGVVMGSPDYMSPEQARGREEVDERTDVWSLCVVLYEAVTGRPPFSGPNYNALLTAIITDEPTPIVAFAAGDGELWSIIARGLAKDRGARWNTMRELGAALAGWCVAQGFDTDVVGTSLTAHWLASSDRKLLSETPVSRRRVPTPDKIAPAAEAVVPEEPDAPAGIVSLAPHMASLADRTEVGSPRLVASRPARVALVLAALVVAMAAWLALRSGATQHDQAPAPVSATTSIGGTTLAPPASAVPAPPPSDATPSPALSGAASTARSHAPAARRPSATSSPPRTSAPSASQRAPIGLEIPDAPDF